MSKFLDITGLAHLISIIKNAFVSWNDTVYGQEVSVDDTPTRASTNLVTSGGVKSCIDEVSKEIGGRTTFTLGQIDIDTGLPIEATNRVYSPLMRNPRKVYVPTNISVSFRYYYEDGTYKSYSGWMGSGEPSLDTSYPLVRIVASYSNNRAIDDASLFDELVTFKGIPERLNDLEQVRHGTDFEMGNIDTSSGVDVYASNRCRTPRMYAIQEIENVAFVDGYKFSFRWFDTGKQFIGISNWNNKPVMVSSVAPSQAEYFRLVCAYADDRDISDLAPFDENLSVTSPLSDTIQYLDKSIGKQITGNAVFSSTRSVGNCTILAAKQHTFEDGTPPLYEWFLLGDPDRNLYFSRDLKTRVLISQFSPEGTALATSFSFGILPNGDIIACKMASELSGSGSDGNRENPYVFKASEKWATQHEVDFGSSLKPCGWLENCGFTTLPDGTAMFGEYTRPTVATANCWKIVGDPLIKTNWVVKKSFVLSGSNQSGFKHIHMVTVDHYTGVVYLATGDDDTGAMVFASADQGDNWTQLREGSELYCRMLMMTFTEDYIYWGQDSPGQHYFFRGSRDENGVLDYSTVTQYVLIPGDNDQTFATYGQAYLPEYNAVLLLDREDKADIQDLPVRVITLDDGQIHTIGTLVNTGGGTIGFRTTFSEWYPVDGLVRVGFGFSGVNTNRIKVCGNKYPVNGGKDSVNNLWLKVNKDGDNWSLQIGTYYL